MCGRYTLATPGPAEVRARFPIGESVEVRRRYNIAPGDDVLAVTTDRHGVPRGELLRWGLVPSWANVPDSRLKMINARVETVAERPAFRHPFGRFRCLIIADGFYEWQRSADNGRKRAFHISPAQSGPFAFAGLWSIWKGSAGEVLRSCTILTTAANAAVADLHDRMPVILHPEAEARWIAPSTPRPELMALLEPWEARATVIRPVGPAVNDARFDGPECLEPPPAETDAAPATLF